ncbi:trihelix transcription factor ASIL2 [Tanacetum coccineum]
MEDDDEIRSNRSTGSGSRSASPPSIRRITVPVAASQQNTLTIALPTQQPRLLASSGGGSGGGGGGREDCWSEGATGVLIDAWGERYLELSRGNLKQKHWKEVADIVSSRTDFMKVPKTDIQCKNRIDTVKKKYKLEKAKIAAGGGPSTWRFYDRLEELIGPNVVSKTGFSTPPLRNVGSNSNNSNVPVGIPVGVRSAPPVVQSLRLKQQQERQHQHQMLLQQQHQQQQQMIMQQQHQQKQQQQQMMLQKQQQLQQEQLLQQRKRLRPPPAYSDSESEQDQDQDQSPDSPESDPYERKRIRVSVPFGSKQKQQEGEGNGRGSKDKNWGESVKELTKAIVKFAETYEQAESLKLQQMVEMQKQSMKFAKELELQRMQFFMKTQMELSQLKQSRKAVGKSNNNHFNNNNHNHSNSHHISNHNTINNDDHSDGSNN